MAFSLYVDPIKHDLVIQDGSFKTVSGAAEIIQRIKVTLWHYLGEYFLNTGEGTPWYESILGRKSDAGIVSSIIRARILSVDNVRSIRSFESSFNSTTREYEIKANINITVPGQENAQAVSFDLAVNPEQ